MTERVDKRTVTTVRLTSDRAVPPVTLAFTGDELRLVEAARDRDGAQSRNAWIRATVVLAAHGLPLDEAAAAAGLQLAPWVRAICLVAAGHVELLDQLNRVLAK